MIGKNNMDVIAITTYILTKLCCITHNSTHHLILNLLLDHIMFLNIPFNIQHILIVSKFNSS